ncbi:hypothetical protein AUK11_01320 [bacterium CG2_30_37_16]|nr:MAG: hypothetical protein AUK11_01320 [bacterium CG2_30_37_16]PIX99072.1 MAG: hypothetical protein COZ22_03500 [bacterium (Candidatus Howlettbacteria) CG_4_10_14_3_um_filter_37_10]PJB05681.1 MAG: hypothetical protein CO123_03520 [bacterium (Candidatus Howlettbacteria) CG_4_9_14_3_um_filter_37_10]
MTMDLYKKVEAFIDDAGEKDSALKELIPHFKRTAYWVLILRPDADESFKIAALAHDFDKIYNLEEQRQAISKSSQGTQDKDLIKSHQEDASNMLTNFLLKNGAEKNVARRVKMLVSRHEEGGNEEQDILKDADSISFLETNVEHFIGMLPLLGYDKVRVKFDYMYNRITSEKTKEIALPMHKNAINELTLSCHSREGGNLEQI